MVTITMVMIHHHYCDKTVTGISSNKPQPSPIDRWAQIANNMCIWTVTSGTL